MNLSNETSKISSNLADEFEFANQCMRCIYQTNWARLVLRQTTYMAEWLGVPVLPEPLVWVQEWGQAEVPQAVQWPHLPSGRLPGVQATPGHITHHPCPQPPQAKQGKEEPRWSHCCPLTVKAKDSKGWGLIHYLIFLSVFVLLGWKIL